jgi:hypothetical protein
LLFSLIPGKVWGIGRGLDAVLPFTCYFYWFSCYFNQRVKLMKARQCEDTNGTEVHQMETLNCRKAIPELFKEHLFPFNLLLLPVWPTPPFLIPWNVPVYNKGE